MRSLFCLRSDFREDVVSVIFFSGWYTISAVGTPSQRLVHYLSGWYGVISLLFFFIFIFFFYFSFVCSPSQRLVRHLSGWYAISAAYNFVYDYRWYLQASHVAAKNGKPYNQLAIIALSAVIIYNNINIYNFNYRL